MPVFFYSHVLGDKLLHLLLCFTAINFITAMTSAAKDGTKLIDAARRNNVHQVLFFKDDIACLVHMSTTNMTINLFISHLETCSAIHRTKHFVCITGRHFVGSVETCPLEAV